jgi:hypothetical protein
MALINTGKLFKKQFRHIFACYWNKLLADSVPSTRFAHFKQQIKIVRERPLGIVMRKFPFYFLCASFHGTRIDIWPIWLDFWGATDEIITGDEFVIETAREIRY